MKKISLTLVIAASLALVKNYVYRPALFGLTILSLGTISTFAQAPLTFSQTLSLIQPASVPAGQTKADVVLANPAGFTFFEAADFGTSTNVTVTLTGGAKLLFQAAGTGGTGGAVANTSLDSSNDNGTDAFSTAGSQGGANQTTGNSNFDTVLNNYAFDGNPQVITLNGLTSGTAYKVYLFGVDNRGNWDVPSRTIQFYDPNNTSSTSPTYSEGSNQFTTVTFTATGTTEKIDLNGVSSAGMDNINALVVYKAIPKPS
jgi:hypothetical protein